MKTKDKEYTIGLNLGRTIYVTSEEFDFTKSSNIPFIDVEDLKNWKAFKIADGNPNLIGQIHTINDEPVFHLCYNPLQRILTKKELLAIVKGIEYIEDFIKSKK